jgi:phosphoenolpyruvate carboxykinase (GTP)
VWASAGATIPVGVGGLATGGLDVSEGEMAELLRAEPEEWKAQLPQFREHLAKFDRLPPELDRQLDALEERLG